MTTTAAPTPPLLRLPAELLLRVSSYLNTVDLGTFRLISKQVESCLFESFAREFFTKRQFMTEQISLDALVGIANHKTLAPRLKEVIISLDAFPLELRESDHFRARYIDREVLLATGEMLQMLAEAFSKLPNLCTVGLRDYNARGRIREGEDARWRSFGWTLLHADPGDPKFNMRGPLDPQLPDQVYALVHFALIKAAARPQSINVFLRQARLSDLAFSYIKHPGINDVLRGLKTLLLSLGEHPSSSDRYEYLAHILCQTPELEHLRLNFKEGTTVNFHTFFDWLRSPPNARSSPQMPTSVDFPRLTTLELGMLTIHPTMLVEVVSKFEAIRSLSLWKIVLQVSSKTLRSQDAFPWSAVLLKLAKAIQQPRNVRSIMIGWSGPTSHTSFAVQNKFASKINVKANGEKELEGAESTVHFQKRVGYDAKEWLEDLAEKARLPHEATVRVLADSDVDSEMSEDEDFDEDDDDDDLEDEDNGD